MDRLMWRKRVCAAFLLCAVTASGAPAQTLTTLVNFNGTNGCSPYASLAQGLNGQGCGTTYGGGANGDGTVFKITAAGTLTTLHSFDETDGAMLAFLVTGSQLGREAVFRFMFVVSDREYAQVKCQICANDRSFL